MVFGDIGTSPLYALKESFHAAHGLGIQPENVLGIFIHYFWCLMLIISIKYVAIVMRADNNGEGGIMALLALNLRKAKIADNKKIYMIAIGFIGASLFFGDGIITQPFRYCLRSKGCLLQPMCLTRSLCLLQLLLSSRCFGAKARYGVCR